MTVIDHGEAQRARGRLAATGWIPARSEFFRHLPPPGLDVWLGGDVEAARAATPASTPAGDGWTVDVSPRAHSPRVETTWLDAISAGMLHRSVAPPGTLASPRDPFVDRFAWAHRAICRDGLRLRVGGPRTADGSSGEPVSLVVRLRPRDEVEAPLLVIELRPGTRCVLVELHERHGIDAAVVQNLEVQVRLGRGATLWHLRVATPAAGDRIAQRVQVQLAERACYRQALIASGSRYHLQRTEFDLPSPHVEAHIGAALFAAGTALEQQVETHHAAGSTESAVESLLLARGKATGVVNAYSHIARGCDAASVRQQLSAIPTGGQPKAVLRPHLEIHHDNVQAVHGATWGALPEDALFYARQRGIDERTARALIVEGMLRALLERSLGEADLLAAQGLDAALARAVATHLAGNAEVTHG